MKTLSVKQPWAWLLAHGYKDIENRTWSRKYRGVFLIHAGVTFDAQGYAWVKENFPHIPLPAPKDFERGGIVGRADLVDVVPPGSHLNGVCTSPWYFGEVGFRLADATPLPFVPVKGQLLFFEVELPQAEPKNAYGTNPV